MAIRAVHDELFLASSNTATDVRLERLLQPTFHRLAEMAALPQGWDSYDADPPSPVALATARGLLLHVVRRLGARAGDRVKPFAVAPFDGGVQLEWRATHAEIEIDVDAEGDLSYLYVDNGSAERRFEEGEGLDWRAAIDLVAKVLVPPSTR